MSNLPTGTVTFLFTDIEGSTKLARDFPAALPAALTRHHAILRQAIEGWHGHIFQVVGDAFCAAFHQAGDGLNAAQNASQRTLHAEAWGATPVKVRMGLHTGGAVLNDGEYQGYLMLAQAQRVMLVAYGGQTLVSDATAATTRNSQSWSAIPGRLMAWAPNSSGGWSKLGAQRVIAASLPTSSRRISRCKTYRASLGSS